jgi:hypothetical protein
MITCTKLFVHSHCNAWAFVLVYSYRGRAVTNKSDYVSVPITLRLSSFNTRLRPRSRGIRKHFGSYYSYMRTFPETLDMTPEIWIVFFLTQVAHFTEIWIAHSDGCAFKHRLLLETALVPSITTSRTSQKRKKKSHSEVRTMRQQ